MMNAQIAQRLSVKSSFSSILNGFTLNIILRYHILCFSLQFFSDIILFCDNLDFQIILICQISF